MEVLSELRMKADVVDEQISAEVSTEGFETMTSDSESDISRAQIISRSVRFAEHREIRRMPADEAQEAREARLPYSPPMFDCSFSVHLPDNIKYTVFFFAPMAFLVAVNLGGVFVVSQFSVSLKGALLAQISSVSYALYLTLYMRYQEKNGEISINLMFGKWILNK
ncbi:hypothetical protein NECAME_06811 [Necator americanus]|uniref:Uncharacterized protein n=1 Tax=Necator americanus TaxID=51031 RepID=W2TR95_NECAM|nr:hypothetical protein NECAME_06811 [Necator americanus]ETN84575.1 hypothetical protein NECAME_06811 [Necator americanus]